jgi:excisionase family DNA binding protein
VTGHSHAGILERLIFRETVQEALALMAPEDLLLAAGRAAGLSDAELADRFNLDEATVSQRLGRARDRIAAEIPELRVLLAGRRHRSHSRPEPEAGEDAGRTLEEVAAALGVGEATVAVWLQEKKFPGAYRVGNEWRIPAGSWDGVGVADETGG